MRRCALWITPWVDPNTEVILDTSAMTDEEWRLYVHNGPDTPPKDTVLVLVHAARHEQLTLSARFAALFYEHDINGSLIAAYIVDKRCQADPELRRRLRW